MRQNDNTEKARVHNGSLTPPPATSEDCVLSLHGLRKTFHGNEIITQFDMSVHLGECVCIIGRSGCGKSTLLRLAAGLVKPDSGIVATRGTSALGFQDSRLVPWLSIWDNITLGMDGSKSDRRQLASTLLRTVDLSDDFLTRLPTALSGGQAQRVSLARALARRPDMLLLDEPFGALDALTRWDMQQLLLDLRASEGFSMVMVTHDIDEALRMGDRILVMENGRITHTMTLHGHERDSEHRPLNHLELSSQLRRWLASHVPTVSSGFSSHGSVPMDAIHQAV